MSRNWVFLLVGLLVSCATPYQFERGTAFGTYYTIQYQHASAVPEMIAARLTQVDTTFSLFNSSSELSRWNRNEIDCVDTLFQNLFHLSEKVSEQTSGAFDPTVAPLTQLYGFGTTEPRLPTREELDSILAFVDYRKLHLHGNLLVKDDRRTQLDFGAMAKGLACDLIASSFHEVGMRNYIIEIGGEVVAKGVNPEGNAWQIGIASPNNSGEIQATLCSKDISMATSGNYRNVRTVNHLSYAHSIDPHAGRPMSNDLLSVTVFAPTCAESDAYATAFMIFGVQSTIAWLEKHSEICAFLIYKNGAGVSQTWASPAIAHLFCQHKKR